MAPILPKKKKAILEFVSRVIETRGYAPTLTEIADHFKLSSLATVHEHLDFLEKRGFIKKSKQDNRAIEIIDQSHTESLERAGMLLPLVGVIAAGSPIEALQDEVEKIEIPGTIAAQNPSYILRVKGDSMIENFIAEGDMVVVKQTQNIKNGDMVVALLEDGTATLKEFYKEKKGVRLQPANKKYKPLHVTNVTLQGKVVGVIRSYA